MTNPSLRPIGARSERTLASPAEVQGVGFITGSQVRLTFRPAAPQSGIYFQRTDLPNAPPIAACASSVTGTARRTTLGSGVNSVTLTEHALAALAGLRIDNCLITLDGPEPPGLDGSAGEFVDAILTAGVRTLPVRQTVYTVSEPISVTQGRASLTLHPARELAISYLLDYGPHAAIPPQVTTYHASPEAFASEIARCRTFLLESEAHELQQSGVGRHLTANELIVYGPRGILDNRLRFADEPARHKVLDILGDLALCGIALAGHIVACRSGHPLNVELARTISRPAVSQPCRRAA